MRQSRGGSVRVVSRIRAAERIHTKNSHECTREVIASEAAEAGLRAAAHDTDERNWFDVALLAPAGA